jgi:PAS domain S-box-containing protein
VGPYVALNAVLVGAFGFAAVYHLVLWSQSRRDAILLIFICQCVICAAVSANLIALVVASTPAEGQRALDLRTDLAVLGQITALWLMSLIAGVRARWFVWFTTAAFLLAVFANAVIAPLAGVVTGVERVAMSWGEEVSILHRESQSFWLRPLYLVGSAVPVFGFVCAARLWARDRIGGALLATASAGLLAGMLWGVLVDTTGRQGPYLGALPYAVWVLLLSIEIARDYRLRAVRLAAAERRFHAIFDQTFQFIGLLSLDGTLLEANRTALVFAGLQPTDVLGKPFWDTPWWAHSPTLQERLRQAVRAAASGEVVRFEATHPDRTGRLRYVDFSLKPVHDEHGAVSLLIPEGRDITERKHAQQALEESREQLRGLADGLLLAREEERTTIARDIHDVLGQTLTALKMDVAWIGRRLDGDVPSARAKLAAMATLIDDTVVAVRRIATDLRPGILDDLGLAAAVEWQAREFESRTGIHCALHASLGDGALDPTASTAVFRIFQESLTNVTRHSQASHVAITLERRDGDLILEVRDDGIGIAEADASNVRSIGLAGMRERAQLVGGAVSIAGSPGAGTTVRVQIPWRREAHV